MLNSPGFFTCRHKDWLSVLVEHGCTVDQQQLPLPGQLQKYFADRLQDPEEVSTVILPGRLLKNSVALQAGAVTDTIN